jgi:hypothetical protein
MTLARVVSFDGVDADRMAALTADMESSEPPEGLEGSELLVLHDPDAAQALAIVLFADEDAYRRGETVLEAMPGPDTPGRRTSVTKYDVAVRMQA